MILSRGKEKMLNSFLEAKHKGLLRLDLELVLVPGQMT
jgi:hypothetical protein